MRIISVDKLNDSQLEKVDEFILSEGTNGEFINTIKYLSYHQNKFIQDSIIIWSDESGCVEGALLASVDKSENKVVSHMGTTFAGPILKHKQSITQKEYILNMMLDYYEKKYKQVVLKLAPGIYSVQPDYTINYFLLKRGYQYGMTALANVINISMVKDEADVLHLFNGGRRNHVKKALKNSNLVFSDCKSIDADIWDNMNKNLKEKFSSRTTHSLDEIRKLQEKFPDSILPFYSYTNTGKYGAFALAFCFKNVFHTQYLDVNYEVSGEYPNLFLIFHLILWAKKKGYNFFSLGGSTEEGGDILNYGLYNYKSGYGGGNIILPKFERRIYSYEE